MAAVTGVSYPDEENFSRRGSGAGRFQQLGGQGFDISQVFQDLMGRLAGKEGGPKVTGDIGESGASVTYGGGGRGSGQGAARTTGGAGGSQPGGFRLTGLGQLPQAQTRLAGGLGIGATALGLAPGFMGSLQSQGLGAATASTGAGLGVAAVTAPISKALMFAPHPLAKAAGFGLQALAPALAQQGVAGLMGKAEAAAQRPGAGPDITIPGTNIPLTETAAIRQQREFDRAQQLQDIQQIRGAELALNKELIGYMMTQEVQQAKAMAPIMERAQRAQLTNAQAMLNSQTAAYQQLGRSAMMGRLATVGQQERGATMRQALATNPYIGATLQAPQISFG
jgi:hypothetical protein